MLPLKSPTANTGAIKLAVERESSVFTQTVIPAGNLLVTWILAAIPVVALLFLLAVVWLSTWVATLIGSLITFLLGLNVWRMPLGAIISLNAIISLKKRLKSACAQLAWQIVVRIELCVGRWASMQNRKIPVPLMRVMMVSAWLAVSGRGDRPNYR
jgi:hypothetical protein